MSYILLLDKKKNLKIFLNDVNYTIRKLLEKISTDVLTDYYYFSYYMNKIY